MAYLKYKDIIKALEPYKEQEVCAVMAQDWVQFFTEDGMRTILPIKVAPDDGVRVISGYKDLNK